MIHQGNASREAGLPSSRVSSSPSLVGILVLGDKSVVNVGIDGCAGVGLVGDGCVGSICCVGITGFVGGDCCIGVDGSVCTVGCDGLTGVGCVGTITCCVGLASVTSFGVGDDGSVG